MSGQEFLQQLKTAVELLGLEVGDKYSDECIEYSNTHPNCRGCRFEPGCATMATVIYNMIKRKKKGIQIRAEDWDKEIHNQAALAKSGIMPTKDIEQEDISE